MLRSTFYAFTTASRALAINQKSLDVVGQNISNLGTLGYTRQRVDRYSMSANQRSMYATRGDGNVGQGVGMQGISQSRDPFLDIRFRKEAPKVGELDARLTVLEDIETVFDETTMNGITSQISDLVKQLQTLSSKTGQPEFDGIVKTSAELLTRLFNQFSNKLDGTRKEQEFNLESIAVPKVNDLLKGLSNVNANIKKEQMTGGNPLELLDQRNVILDELSQYVKIDVKTTSVSVSPGVSYDEMTVSLSDDAGNLVPILDPKGYKELSAFKDPTSGKYSIRIPDGAGGFTDVTNRIPTGNFKGYLDMLNEAGEFDQAGVNIRGIGYYEGMLDNLAGKFATEMNALNQSVFDNGTPPKLLIQGGDLFESKDGNPITAGNIKISDGWANNDYGIVSATKEQAMLPGGAGAEGANGNILKMIALFGKKVDFTIPSNTVPGTNITLFSGTFQEMLSQTGNVLALEVKSSKTNITNYMGVLNGISAGRDSISAVSLDEEGISLLQYQKAYNAAARLMTTLDEAIGTIINNMGMVGR